MRTGQLLYALCIWQGRVGVGVGVGGVASMCGFASEHMCAKVSAKTNTEIL